MLANDAEPLLKLGANGIFQPKQVIGLQTLAEASGFNRRQPVVDIVEQMNVIAVLFTQGFEKLRHMEKILFR